MKRVMLSAVVAMLFAIAFVANASAQCSSGSCGMGGMAASSGMGFRGCGACIKPVRGTLWILGRTAKGIARAGVYALPGQRWARGVVADGGLYRREIVFRPGPFGRAYIGREQFVKVSPYRKHDSKTKSVESGKPK